MITEISMGKNSQECPVCGNQINGTKHKQRQEFKEMYVDKYIIVCSKCNQLYFVTCVFFWTKEGKIRAVLRKFFPTDDLYDLNPLFPYEEWRFNEFYNISGTRETLVPETQGMFEYGAKVESSYQQEKYNVQSRK